MKHAIKSIIGGLIFLVLLAIAVFTMLGQHISDQTETDVRRIAHVHLKGICELESDRFDAIVHLRFQQMDALLRELVKNGATLDHGKLLEVARRFAEFQTAENCTLISASGEMETVFGDPIMKLGDEAFLKENMHAGRRIVTGAWTDAMQLAVYASPMRLPMSNGRTSIGLLWCKPIAAFKDMLYLNRKDGLVKYRIIRRDASYLVDESNIEAPTYFEHLRRHAVPDNGQTAEAAIARFQQAIASNEVFTLSGHYVDADQNTDDSYCVRAVPLKGSNWYLVSIMSYGAIDNALEDMDRSRLLSTLLAVLVLAAGIFSVFFLYMYMTVRQLTALSDAKRATEQALQEAHAAVAREEAATAKAVVAQKEAEAAKEYAEQANRTKSEFLSNMSHDIRTPMNAIVGLTTIARAHKDDGSRVEDCLKKITVSGKQLLGLINDVLDMSKIESGKMTLKMENLSLRETMETLCDIVRPQIESNGQNFDVYVSRIISEQVFCDGVRLNQVLLNFLSNAMKFTPEGGSIDVELWQEPSHKGDGWVRTHFAVKDTGMGMSEEYQKKLFTAFEREDSHRVHRTQGTGLGLTITKYIVDAMDGTIEVESAPGKGTRFHVIVDFERVPSGSDDLSLPPWSILVVDDSKDMCKSAVEILTELGARPHVCHSGATAVEMAARAHATGEDYFVAIIDYRMPGMNGIETAVKIREVTDGKVPELLVSAYDWSDIEEEAKAANIAGFIAKPLFKSTLYRALTRLAGDEGTEGILIEEASPSIEGMRVLLAEDQPINAEIATTILEEAGATVTHAEDGLVARKLFADSEPGHFDVILMDLRMPHMDGIGATTAIRGMNRPDAKTVPIIALTADAFAEDAQRCMDAGMNAHLAKPIDATLLLRMMASIKEERQASK